MPDGNVSPSHINQTYFHVGRYHLQYKRLHRKQSGELPIPFLFWKIDKFCLAMIGVKSTSNGWEVTLYKMDDVNKVNKRTSPYMS